MFLQNPSPTELKCLPVYQKSDIPEEAFSKGYEPCQRCKPPVLDVEE
jgi:hypothetical protein